MRDVSEHDGRLVIDKAKLSGGRRGKEEGRKDV